MAAQVAAVAHSSTGNQENVNPLATVDTHRDNDNGPRHDIEHTMTSDTTQTTIGGGLLYRNGKVVLIPAPTKDPRDPLNLSKGRKFWACFFLCLFGAMAAAAEIILGAMLPVFALVYANVDVHWLVVITTFGGLPRGSDPLKFLDTLQNGQPIWKIYLLASLPVLMMGVANFFLVPMAIAVGRRPVILGCGVLAIAGCCWAGASQSLGSHLGARCLQALGAGTVESLIPFIVQDMVYVHQRNSAISGIFGTQGIIIICLGIASPYIIIYRTWRYVYWITAAAAGGFLIGVFFLVPETRWERTKEEMRGIPREPVDEAPAGSKRRGFGARAWQGFLDNQTKFGRDLDEKAPFDERQASMTSPTRDSEISEPGKAKKPQRYSAVYNAWQGFLHNQTKFGDPEYYSKKAAFSDEENDSDVSRIDGRGQQIDRNGYPKRTFWYDIALFQGKMEWHKGWLALLDTLRTFFYPQIFFITMLNSAMIAAALASGYTVSPALITQPYDWPFLHIGFCLFPMVISVIFVWLFAGFGADYLANYIAKKRGERLPEYQLINLILPTVTGIVGSVIFGYAGDNLDKYPWPVFLFALGLMGFGFLAANTIGAVYVLECYPQLAGPALVNIASFRCLIAFVLSFRVSEWVADLGYKNSMTIYACIMGFFAAFLPVVFFYGPAWRKRWPGPDRSGSF